jgi:hypothetical protein
LSNIKLNLCQKKNIKLNYNTNDMNNLVDLLRKPREFSFMIFFLLENDNIYDTDILTFACLW